MVDLYDSSKGEKPKSKEEILKDFEKDERFGSFTGEQWDASNIIDRYYNDVNSLSNSDYEKLKEVAKEIRNRGEKSSNDEWSLEKSASQIIDQHISKRVESAKKTDRYDLDFLEAIQNKGLMGDDKERERLKAYREYLEDPEDFWKNKRHKYPDA